MPNIDERVVSMQFDNKEFDPKLKKSQKTFEEFEESLSFDKGSKALKNFEKNMDKFDTKSMSNKLGALGKSFSAFETVSVGALLSVGNRLENFINKALRMTLTEGATKGWGDYAEKVTAVQTIMAATASQFEDTATQIKVVNGQLDDLRTFADETSFSFKDMTSNIGKFTSQGIDLRTSVRAMEGISTWAALSGASTWEASRAYYNLSQALGTGAVTLIDWKSIENANMATVEFKKTALETAEAMGTLKKQADGTYKTLQGHAVSIANFNQNLSDRWLTSNVLLSSLDVYGKFSKEILEYTNQMEEVSVRDAMRWIDEYADGTKKLDEILALAGDDAELVGEMVVKLSTEEYNLGRRAFRAAQETKTFAEALNYTKEAVATGWSQTWELIFGDYNEARKFWTDVTDDLYNIFVAGGDFRNDVLELWSKTFGRQDFIDGVQAIREFIFGTDERKGVLDYIREAWKEIFPFWKSADNIASALVRLTERFRIWAENLELTSDQVETLRSVVRFLARALKFAFSLIKSIWIFVSPFLRWTRELLGALSGLFRALLDGTGAILDSKNALEAFRLVLLGIGAILAFPIKLLTIFINWLKTLGDKTLPEVIDELNGFWNNIVNFFKRLGNKFLEAGGNIVRGFWTGFTRAWNAVVKGLTTAFNGVIELAKRIFKIHSPSVVFEEIGSNTARGLIGGMTVTMDKNKNVIAAAFGKIFGPVNNWLKETTKNAGGVGNLLKEILGFLLRIAAMIGLIMLAINLLKALFAASRLVYGLGDLLENVGDALYNISKGIKSYLKKLGNAAVIRELGNMILKMAIAIAILVAAFIVLAKIDLPKIKQAGIALGIITGVLVALVVVLMILAKHLARVDKLFVSGGYLTALSVAFMAIAIGVAVLAGALATLAKALETVSFGKLMGSVLALSLLTSVVVVLFSNMSYYAAFNKGLIRGALSMILIALAVKVLAKGYVAMVDSMMELIKKYEAMDIVGATITILGAMTAMGVFAVVMSRATASLTKALLPLVISIVILMRVLVKLADTIRTIPNFFGYLTLAVIVFAALAGIVALFGVALRALPKAMKGSVTPQMVKEFSKFMWSVVGLLMTVSIIAKILMSVSWSAIGKLAVLVAGSVLAVMLITKSMWEIGRTISQGNYKQVAAPALLKNFRDILVVFLVMILEFAVIGLAFSLLPTGMFIKALVAITVIAAVTTGMMLVLAKAMKDISIHGKNLSASPKSLEIMKAMAIVMTVMFGIAAIAVGVFSFINAGKLWSSVGAVYVLAIAVSGMLIAISFALKNIMGKGVTNSQYNEAKLGKFMAIYIATLAGLVILAGVAAGLTFIDQTSIWKSVGVIATLGVLLIGLTTLLILVSKLVKANTLVSMIPILVSVGILLVSLIAIAGIAILLGDYSENIWRSVGAIAALAGILIAGVALLIGLAAIVGNVPPIIAGLLAVGGMLLGFSLVLAIVVPSLAKTLPTFADVLKYFRDTIGAGAIVVGLEILGFAFMIAIAGALLGFVAPYLLMAGIGLFAFGAALVYLGKNKDALDAVTDFFGNFSGKTLGGILLFAVGILALGVAFNVLGIGTLFAAGAFFIWTKALIYMGENVESVAKAFTAFSSITWDVTWGMGKLALGILFLAVAFGVLAVPLTAILVPLAGVIGLATWLVNTLIKLGEKTQTFSAAIDMLHEKLDKITDIIKGFGKALGEIAAPMVMFGVASILLGVGLALIGAGLIVTGVGLLLVVGALFLVKLLLDQLERDHPDLYDIVLRIADALTQLIEIVVNSPTFASMLESIFNAFARIADLGAAIAEGMTKITEGLNTAWDWVKEHGKSMWDDIKGAFSSSKARQEAIRSAYEAGYRIGDSMQGGTKDSLDSHSPSKEMIKIAGYATSGFIIGINKGLPGIHQASENMGNEIIDTVKDVMDIRSPSHVMYELGQNIGEGEMNGANDAYDTAMDLFRSRHAQMVEIARDTATQMESAYEKAAAASAIANIKAQFDALDIKMKTKGQTLTTEEWNTYWKLQSALSTANKEYHARVQEEKKLQESQKANVPVTFKDTAKNIGDDISRIWSDVKDGKITLKEGLSQLWTSLKTNGGAFFSDKFSSLKDWLIGDNGILSGFKDLFNPDKLFEGIDLKSLLPEDDDDDPWKGMQDNFGQPADLSGLDNVSGSGQGTINTYEFVQNNYSPKALSRIEIYRQTNRQFNNFRTREVLAR